MNKTLIMIVSDNNMELITGAILEIENMGSADLIIIDEASDYDLIDELSDNKGIKCIIHDQPQGFGTCLNEAINYALNFDYDYLIVSEYRSEKFRDNLSAIEKNLRYGYDIITCSRTIENYNYDRIDNNIIEYMEVVAASLKEASGLDITDPLSHDKGFNIKSIKDINITEEGDGALLQIFIQGNYYGLNTLEIPCEDDVIISEKDFDVDDSVESLISIIETEKYLYSKGSIN